jgi:purine-nucleoside phosphorylase
MSTPFGRFWGAVDRLRPRVAVVMGSGLSDLPKRFQCEAQVGFGEVPGLVSTSVVGHAGRIEVGWIDSTPCMIYRGRLHFYEGHSWQMVGEPVRWAVRFGIRSLLLTNAAGGMHPQLQPGCMMILKDHINWQRPDSVLKFHSNQPSCYSPRLIELLRKSAETDLVHGVYLAVTGPCYETPAEIRAMIHRGADAVGMSTAHEAMIAYQHGLEVAGLSFITNRAAGLSDSKVTHEEVLEVARLQAPNVSRVIERFVVSA